MMKINVPNGEYVTFQVSMADADYEYNITMYFDAIYKMWYIRIKYNNIDTGFTAITVTPILFSAYKSLLPHCFFCKTESGFNPNSSDSFNCEHGDAVLLIEKWEEREKEFLD